MLPVFTWHLLTISAGEDAMRRIAFQVLEALAVSNPGILSSLPTLMNPILRSIFIEVVLPTATSSPRTFS